jgi:hypothetical protein
LVTVNSACRSAELAYVLDQSGAAGTFLVPEFRSPMAASLDEVGLASQSEKFSSARSGRTRRAAATRHAVTVAG